MKELICACILGLAVGTGLYVPAEGQFRNPAPFDVEFRIPKGYNGWLFLAFDMPGGMIPDKLKDFMNWQSEWPITIVIDFDDSGLARYGFENLPADIGKSILVERGAGTQIPLAVQRKELGTPLPARAALRDLRSGEFRKKRRHFVVETFLVGDPKTFPDKIVGYKREEINRLLLKHFGLPLPE